MPGTIVSFILGHQVVPAPDPDADVAASGGNDARQGTVAGRKEETAHHLVQLHLQAIDGGAISINGKGCGGGDRG